MVRLVSLGLYLVLMVSLAVSSGSLSASSAVKLI